MRAFLVVLLFLSFTLSAQSVQEEKYIFPIQPGQTASLAGNMGELRANHFHTGIDIRTNNQIGWPVHAAKSGYVSRVSISPGGYGNVMYVTHPDGNTTLYAHLETFKGAVANYVRQEQYRRKSFDIDLYFRKNQFPVKQGDTIALGGNTGSSSGPHLHFDIRDKDNNALDPLAFGFGEVVDASKPYVEKLALRTFGEHSRINDRFGRTEFYALRAGSDFSLPYPILAHGTIGIELLAKDKLAAGSPYFGGVNFIEVFANNKLVFKQTIDKLDVAEGRAINTLLSFRSLRANNNKFYKLYVDDGNTLPFYSGSSGKINVGVQDTVSIRIVLKDTFGNQSSLSFILKGAEPDKQLLFDNALKENIKVDIWDQVLFAQANTPIDSNRKALFYSNGSSTEVLPVYGGKFTSTYLADLSRLLVDSIVVGKDVYRTNIKDRIPSDVAYTYYGNDADVYFPKGALYDTLYFQLKRTGECEDGMLQIGDPSVPLHKFIAVTWKFSTSQIQWDNTWAVYRKNGELGFAGGKFVNGSVQFNTREFGNYVLAQDTVPPEIKPIIINATSTTFKIKDDLSGIERYEAMLNGKWLLMQWDGKSGTLKSEKLDATQPFKGELMLTVTDRCGNSTTTRHTIP